MTAHSAALLTTFEWSESQRRPCDSDLVVPSLTFARQMIAPALAKREVVA